ncbi:hypothetical protein BUE80_DR005200 [Diplocarpon rosae]|nr:hypothetical protein BUE80_DR005200 [Diplocarpon rosae]
MLSHTSEPLTSFTVFPKLPFELRCMIWEASCCSRTIELDYHDIDGFQPRAANPMALQICRESRELIIPLYPLCFGTFFHPARTRFNFVNDTLLVGSDTDDTVVPHLFSTFTHSEISGLRFLALESCFNEHVEDANGAPTLTFQLLNLVKRLPSLRELLIVHNIGEMIDRSLDCAEGHTVELYDSPPQAFNHPAVYVDPLPDEESSLLKRWPVAKCRPVYGWRRCPDIDMFTVWDTEDDIEDDTSDNDAYYSRRPAWNPYSELFDPEDYDHGYGFSDEDDDEGDEDGEDDEEGEHGDDIIVEYVD